MEATDSSYIKPDLLKSLGSSINSIGVYKTLKDVFKSAFISNCNLDDASVTEEEIQTLEELDELEVVDNLKNLLDTLLTFKSNCKSSNTGELATRCDQLEKMLQKQEAEVRNHIKIEHQLKLHIDTVQQKVIELEKSNSEAQTCIKEMEGRGLESMQSKLQKIEARFQSELNKVVKEYRDEAYNEAKKNEKIKRLEEMYEKKEKAYVKLQQEYMKIKQKLEENPIFSDKSQTDAKKIKTRSVSDDKFKLRRSSYNEDLNKVQHIASVYKKDKQKEKQNHESKFVFKIDSQPVEKFTEPVPPPLELRQSIVGKANQYSSRRHIRSNSDCARPVTTKKFKIKNR